jgi:hypothetical protein
MRSTLPAIAEPPWQMTTPGTAQTVITVILAVAVAAFVVAAARDWHRTGSPVFMLTLAGGLVCSLNEAVVDVLGHCHFPTDGWIVYRAFDRAVPIWVVLAYLVFFGALPYVMAKAFQRGFSRRAMWAGIGIFGVLNVLLEIPMLKSGLYVYYGEQPFTIAGFPISWLVINCLGALFAAVVITRLAWLFTGARQMLIVVIPYATYMSSWVLAMPHFLVTNTDAPSWVRMLAAAVSLILGLIAIDVLIRLGTGQLRLLPPETTRPSLPAMAVE